VNIRAQAQFHLGFIRSALAIAIFAGFAIGAHLAAVIGLGFPLGKGFYSFIQIHGHLQLVGWAGLFIIGISLHFIPRLAGIPLSHPEWLNRILWLITAGLITRAIFHSHLPYVSSPAVFHIYSVVIALSGLSELAGIILYIALLLTSIRATRQSGKERLALQSVKPYFAMMQAGWLLYAGLNVALLIHMAITGAVTVNQPWDDFALHLFIGLVLLPVAFAFSVRMFPLYLRLPAPEWPVGKIGLAYLFSFALQTLPTLPPFLSMSPETAFFISAIGQCGKSTVIFLFVWKLDLLLRRRAPWTVYRKFQPGPERQPTRAGLPDYGEFGRFERLLYAAYLWLLFGALLELLSGLATIMRWEVAVSTDTIRHSYLVGFITLLIMGMAPRMIPGFIQKKLASTKLVEATFWLGNAAVICRIVPLLLPEILLEKIPPAILLSQWMFALAGIFGLVAVSCLAVNLWRTSSDNVIQDKANSAQK
jgi:uncharacterized protein involved in response to NO